MSDLVFRVRRLRADQDAIALIAALQAQFPQDRIHLLIGFAGEVDCTGGDDGRDNPVEIAPNDPRWRRHKADQDGAQPNVIARHCAVDGIVLVAVPPSEDVAFHAARFPAAASLSSPTPTKQVA